MSTKEQLYEKIRNEREKGISISTLSKRYSLSKSTVSLLCRDVKLTKEAKEKIKKKWLQDTAKSRIKGTTSNKNKRIESVKKEEEIGREMIGKLSDRELLILGAGLYWAEGSKKETGEGFNFVNSDPLMIKLVYRWLIEVMKIKKEDIKINLAINISHKNREDRILKFWSNLLDFKMQDFGNTTFIKSPYKRKYSNHDEYYGMIRMKVKASSWLRRRIIGMIKVFTNNADVAQVVRAFHS